MSFRKCEKLSARITEKAAFSAIRRPGALRVSLRSADTLVLIIPFLRDANATAIRCGVGLAALCREKVQMPRAFARYQLFEPMSARQNRAGPCGHFSVSLTSKTSFMRNREGRDDQADTHRPRESEGLRPGGVEAVLSRCTRLQDRRGGP